MKPGLFTALAIVLAEGMSIIAFFYPATRFGIFFIICGIVIYCAIRAPKYILVFLIADLVIDSFGRLLSWNYISLRMLLFAGVMLGFVLEILKTYGISYTRILASMKVLKEFKKAPLLPMICGILLVVCVSIGIGISRGYPIEKVLNDANGYLFLLIAFPLWFWRNEFSLEKIMPIFCVAFCALAIKSLIVFGFFSHVDQPFFDSWFYHWIRDTRVGEITPLGDHLVRVFFQSHLYAGIIFLYVIAITLLRSSAYCGTPPKAVGSEQERATPARLRHSGGWQSRFLQYFFLSISSSLILMSLSRSIWIGIAMGLFIALICYRRHSCPRSWSRINSGGNPEKNVRWIPAFARMTLTGVFFGYLILASVHYGFGFTSQTQPLYKMFISRTNNISTEIAALSRYEQLPILFNAIKEHPFFGHGFGKTISVPSTNGMSERFTFEWGYLDMLVDFGIVGFFIIIFLFFQIFKRRHCEDPDFTSGGGNPVLCHSRGGGNPEKELKTGSENSVFYSIFIFLLITHFFTPYLNHPLGIFALLFISLNPHEFLRTRRNEV